MKPIDTVDMCVKFAYNTFEGECNRPSSSHCLLGAPDDVEALHPVVANGISRAPCTLLGWAGPRLRERASARRADFGLALVGSRVRSNALWRATLHNRQIVGGTLHAAVRAVAELEQGLGFPLAVAALVGRSGETHTERGEWRVDAGGFSRRELHGVRHLDHLECGRDLVKAERLGAGAIVVDGQVEVGVIARLESRVGVTVVVRVRHGRSESSERGRGDGEGEHRDAGLCLVCLFGCAIAVKACCDW